MDDYNVSSLHESKNEWCSRLVTLLTPLIVDGYKSILEEAVNLCKSTNETEKYLMTFQKFISRIPQWNPSIIEMERKRICDKSGCVYLVDLITCVHIIQLKILTAMRVGQKQKKIDINIPKLDDFIHKVYIHAARKIYKNVYLFELIEDPLQAQKNNRELEVIVQECILNTIRDSIPVETILKVYMDEEEVVEEIKEKMEQPVEKNAEKPFVPKEFMKDISPKQNLSFDNKDYVKENNGNIVTVNAPKSIERLQEISDQRYKERKLEEEDENPKLKIHNESYILGDLDVHTIEEPKLNLFPDLLIDDIELLV